MPTKKGQQALDNVNEALLLAADGASRQVRRAQARKAHKAANRPGLWPIPKSGLSRAASRLRHQAGSYGRRIIWSSPQATSAAPFDLWFHATKGARCRRVAV